jgi:hypothetical protein
MYHQLGDLQGVEELHDEQQIKMLKSDLQNLLDQENLQCRQKSKQNWFKHGDRNTKYFHACATKRQKSNKIMMIVDEDRRRWDI